MASFGSIWKAGHVLKRINPLQTRFSTAPALAAEWNKNWKPGPYPKTPEERAAAAKKYGLLPKDYEPYPDDGIGWGDYPKVKPMSENHKNPWYNWDYPETRRDYGEVMHIDADKYYEQCVDTAPKVVPVNTGAAFGVCLFLVYLFCIWLFDPYQLHQKALRKQYPYNNLWVQRGLDPAKEPTIKHYTFEPVE